MPPARALFICIDDSDASESSVKWALANIFKEGDEVHLAHVIPRFQLSAAAGPSLPLNQGAGAYDNLIKNAEAFIVERALRHIEQVQAAQSRPQPPPVVHIIKYETDSDSIGTVLCKKAEDLHAAAVVVARYNKSKLQQLFLGSVSMFCVDHCKRPVFVCS